MEIKRITESQFDGMANEWNTLLSNSVSDEIYLRWEWIHTWWEVFKKPGETLFILTAQVDGRLIGIAPLYIATLGKPLARTLRFCSEELSPDYFDFIAENGRESEVVQAMLNYLHASSEWDVMSLDNLRSNSILLPDPIKQFPHFLEISQYCPYIQIAGSFEDYYKTRIQLSKFGLEKKRKKLFGEMGVVHTIVVDENELPRHISDLFSLHEKRAEDKSIETTFAEPKAQEFHLRFSRMLLSQGNLNLQFLYNAKAPVAASYSFNYKNKVYGFQSGFDPAWGKWRVGFLLLTLVLQKAFADGQREYDFLKGTEYYKSMWVNAMREEMLLTVYNKTFGGRLALLIRQAKSLGRKIKYAFRKPTVNRNADRSAFPESSTPAA